MCKRYFLFSEDPCIKTVYYLGIPNIVFLKKKKNWDQINTFQQRKHVTVQLQVEKHTHLKINNEGTKVNMSATHNKGLDK